MKNSQFSRLICFLLFGVDIAAMFIVASAMKGSRGTAIGWIIRNFGYGYYWFVIVAVLLVVASFVIPKKLAEMEKKEEEQQKARDEEFIKLKERLAALGMDVSGCADRLSLRWELYKYTKELTDKKLEALKSTYGFTEVNDLGVAFGAEYIVYDIVYMYAYYYQSENYHVSIGEYIDEVIDLWNFDKDVVKTISYDDVEIYELKGAVRHETHMEGGGVNIGGALAGAALFGGVGAIVGSQVGTQISSHTGEVDERVLVVRAPSKLPEDLIVAERQGVDSALMKLRKIIPDKEYSSAMGYAKAARQQNAGQSYSEELKALKGLLDAGIITQEDFDVKKKQLLGL